MIFKVLLTVQNRILHSVGHYCMGALKNECQIAVLVCSLVFPHSRWQTPSFAAFFCQTSLMCNDLKYFVLKKSDDCANDPVPQRVVSFRLHLLTPPIQIRVATHFQDKYTFQDTFPTVFFHKIDNLVIHVPSHRTKSFNFVIHSLFLLAHIRGS